MGFSVVILEGDPRIAKSLANQLSSHFHAVHLTRSGDEMRERVARQRPEAVILDMEYSRLSDVRSLHEDFPQLPIVCTHRVPDEELWVEALKAGASDMCPADDTRDVLSAVLRNVPIAPKTAVRISAA